MQSSEPILSANADRLSNGQLVERFAASRDESAFAELVRRFGPMILGVTRRLLNSRDDADDATQLVFTELARRAGTIRTPAAVGGWLHTVAVHAAFRLRRRQPGTTPLASDPIDPRLNLDELARRSEFEILSEELDSLPELWREPLVLRYLSGLSNEDAAAQLGTTVTALEGRLKRGKKTLRVKLLRRGVAVASLLAAVGPVRSASAGGVGDADSMADDSFADDWDCVTDAAQELASDPSSLTFVPMETPPMATTMITFKAAVATGVAAVVLTTIAGPGHHPDGLAAGGAAFTTAVTTAFASADEVAETATSVVEAEIATSDDPVTPNASPVPKLPTETTSAALSAKDPLVVDRELPNVEPVINSGPAPSVLPDDLDALVQSAEPKPATEDDPFASDPPVDSDPFGSPSASDSDPFGSPASGTPISDNSALTPNRAIKQAKPQAQQQPISYAEPKSLSARLALERSPVEWDFFDIPLSEAMDFVSDSERIQIWIDEDALSDLGYSTDDSVTVIGQFSSLANGLTAVLSEQLKDLDYVVRGDRLIITTADAADAMLSTRFYPIPNVTDSQALSDAIVAHVVSSPRGDINWSELGGNGQISVLDIGTSAASTLVITQSDRGHAAVANFLDGISSISVDATVSDRLTPARPQQDQRVYPRGYVDRQTQQPIPVQRGESGILFESPASTNESPGSDPARGVPPTSQLSPTTHSYDWPVPHSYQTQPAEVLPATSLTNIPNSGYLQESDLPTQQLGESTTDPSSLAEQSAVVPNVVNSNVIVPNVLAEDPATPETIVAYDLAELNRLLYGDTASDPFATAKLMTWAELSRLSISIADEQVSAEFLVQRGSQIFVKATTSEHLLIRQTIDSLTKALTESGDPKVSGPTNVVEGGGFF